MGFFYIIVQGGKIKSYSNICQNLKGARSVLRQFLATKAPLKTMKNALYFTLKALFVLKILDVCFNFLIMQKNSLIRKIWLFSKFITSQPEKQTFAIHILPNILRRKDNETIKFAHLIEYNMRNYFPENHTQNLVEKLFANHF